MRIWIFKNKDEAYIYELHCNIMPNIGEKIEIYNKEYIVLDKKLKYKPSYGEEDGCEVWIYVKEEEQS